MSSNAGGDVSLRSWLEVWMERHRFIFVLRYLLIARKHPHNSMSSFYPLKIFWIDVVKHLDAEVEAFSQIQDHCGPHLRFRLRFFSFPNFLKGVLLPNWKVVEGEIWPCQFSTSKTRAASQVAIRALGLIQGGSNMTGTDLCVKKPHCAAAVRPWESEVTTSTLTPARVRTCSVLSGSC